MDDEGAARGGRVGVEPVRAAPLLLLVDLVAILLATLAGSLLLPALLALRVLAPGVPQHVQLLLARQVLAR